MVTFRALPDSSSAGLKFGILTMGTATCSWWRKFSVQDINATSILEKAWTNQAHLLPILADSVNGSWLSINASCPEKRAIRMVSYPIMTSLTRALKAAGN